MMVGEKQMNQKKSLIAANWKMYKTLAEAVAFTESLQREVGALEDREVVIAPPYTALGAVRNALWRQEFKLAAQNCHGEEKGAFTGEVSGIMLKDVGCDWVILGHSERRQLFGETDDAIRKKLAGSFKFGLLPILCVGEVLEEREGGKTFAVLGRQLDRALEGLSADQAVRLAIAYEPVWAIGTGKVATPIEAEEVHRFIRGVLSEVYSSASKNVRILYGGSVTPDNIGELIDMEDIDGALVGGASLKPEMFLGIIRKVAEKR
jgi:triosephosphate isomerase